MGGLECRGVWVVVGGFGGVTPTLQRKVGGIGFGGLFQEIWGSRGGVWRVLGVAWGVWEC